MTATALREPPAVAAEPVRQRRRPAATGLLAVVITVPALVIVGLLGVVVYLGFRAHGTPDGALTTGNFTVLFGDAEVWSVVRNTVVYVLVTVGVALFFGTALALLVERSDFGWGRTIATAMVLRILVPGFFTAMGWIFLFHPRIGAVNQWLMEWFHLSRAPVNIVSLVGMGFVEGLALSALVFGMVSASLGALDGSLEEAARASGAGPLRVLFRVTLPLVRPGLLGAGLFAGTIAVSSLDIPLIMGLSNRTYVFSSYLYVATNPSAGTPEYGVPAAFSAVMILLGVAFSLWYQRVLRSGRKYQVVAGKGHRPARIRLGRWRWAAWLFVGGYFLWSTILPVLMVVWMSLLPFVQKPSAAAFKVASLDNYRQLDWSFVERGLTTTLKLMVVAPTLAVLMSLAFSFVVVRARRRYRMVYDLVAFLPQAVPTTVFAFGAMIAALYWTRGWYGLYGTLALLVGVTALTQIAFGTRMFNAGLLQIHVELEEAAAMSGASSWTALRRVTLPLLRPVVTYTWLWLALLSLRDLTVPTLIGGQDTLTLSVASWTLFNSGQVGASSALTLLMILFMTPVVVLFLLLTRKNEGKAPV
ncbi:sn-glycerol-3-phosphate transport system permease protein UgpA [Actinomadura rubteroloni]|uniref:sn-glycerol-3-phosphate transport system permease protein UgpA n=1 Tax=Actinomadura rubteroloni TaxID=1926885 RepID=A0A2P4UH70_9ACTN|nr:iron ABC transporter permease [Actinomadura rubteroloni]POM24356.1 sn-glycerol-3-phosphate transport system permease protein UgpA [Actinomadura rubteroloni]